MVREAADDLARTVEKLTSSVSQINATAAIGATGYYGETVTVRHIPLMLKRAAIIGWIGTALAILLIYLHMKGHF
jgi:hypothetical protein